MSLVTSCARLNRLTTNQPHKGMSDTATEKSHVYRKEYSFADLKMCAILFEGRFRMPMIYKTQPL